MARLTKTGVRHPFATDLATVLALMACATFGIWLTLPDGKLPQYDKVTVGLVALSCLALLKHRTHPRTVATVTTGCTVAILSLGYLLTPLLLAPLMAALYWLAAQTDRRTARLHGVIVLVAVTTVAVATEHTDVVTLLLQTVGPFCWLLLPLTAGDMTRLRRAYIQAVQARADHAERTREEEARLRVAEERMRIARELHDILAHHMALANAQAGTAAHLVLTHPEQTRTILTDLTGTTSAALRELKATLGLLRQDDPVPPAPPAGHTPSIPSAPKAEASLPLAPLPGLSRLPELVSVCASAGLDVVVTTDGERRPLLPGVDLTAYRIVQEALTNVTKHAATTTARVHLHYTDTRVWITITDDGPARPVTPLGDDTGKAGFGLTGMRERAASVGGELRAGPRPEDGFEVATVLPLGMPGPHASEGVPA
ncbi:sensor histidine kinase [Streptomyces subrutilus]|uniref:sensor histidine kinase n=1 Tax=Streptomyces subrutilus TaxID=36818 RepID=UPI0033C16B44